MALSESVTNSLKEAESHIRNALAYAARSERTIVCNQLSRILAEIDGVQSFDSICDKVELIGQ